MAADRYLYLAFLGPLLALAEWGEELPRVWPLRLPRSIQLAALSILVLPLAILSHHHCRAFRDDETLWRVSLRAQPLNPVAKMYLARALLNPLPKENSLLTKRGTEALALLNDALNQPWARQQILVARAKVLNIMRCPEEALGKP